MIPRHETPKPKETPLPPLALEEHPDGPFARNLNRYPDRAQLEEEMPRAKELHRQAEQAVQQLFDELRQHGTTDLDRAHEVMDGMVESIICNPDALALLSRVKRASSYVYARSVSVAINMLLFGRHLGFPRDHMHLLGAAGLLLDVGAAKVPPEILSKNGRLTPEEYETMQHHVHFAIEMLRECKGVSKKNCSTSLPYIMSEKMAAAIPMACAALEIGVPGKMAAIVDCYDALTSERPYARSFTPYDALQHVYSWREHLFHTELVEQFVQCLGFIPLVAWWN